MFLRGKNRVGAAVALAAVLAVVLAAPAGAAPWGGSGEAREFVSGLLPRILTWFAPASNSGTLKCDQGPTIDPNGCPKASAGLPASERGGMQANDSPRVASGPRR